MSDYYATIVEYIDCIVMVSSAESSRKTSSPGLSIRHVLTAAANCGRAKDLAELVDPRTVNEFRV